RPSGQRSRPPRHRQPPCAHRVLICSGSIDRTGRRSEAKRKSASGRAGSVNPPVAFVHRGVHTPRSPGNNCLACAPHFPYSEKAVNFVRTCSACRPSRAGVTGAEARKSAHKRRPRWLYSWPGAARSPILSRFARSTAPRSEILSMAKARGDFTDILVKRGQLGADQIDEALSMQKQTGAKTVQEVLVKLGYVTMQDVMNALAEFHNLTYVELKDQQIPMSVIEMVPESVARENVVIPISLDDGVLKICMSEPSDYDTLQKLQFILNK